MTTRSVHSHTSLTYLGGPAMGEDPESFLIRPDLVTERVMIITEQL